MKTKIYFRYSVVVLLFLIQILFLLAIFREKKNSYLITIFIASLGLLTLYTYRKRGIHHHAHEFESFSVAIWVPIGAVASFWLHQVIGLGPVLGAAIVGTAASFIPDIKRESTYLVQLPAAIYCGAFVGMSDARIAGDIKFVIVAGFFTGIFLMVSKSLLKGVGGKLGTVAFLGVLLTYFLIYLFRR